MPSKFLFTIILSSLSFYQFCLPFILQAKDNSYWPTVNPYECPTNVERMTYEKIRDKAQKIITDRTQPDSALEFCEAAEILKRVGKFQAEKYYKLAIEKEPREPVYEVFYADYLRNFRGANEPLFPESEEHYIAALKKFEILKNDGRLENCDKKSSYCDETQYRIERGLIDLHQRDGLPLISSPLKVSKRAIPNLFFTTVNRFADSANEFDKIDDARSFTSESLFASSAARLNRPLTNSELKNIIRNKKQFESFNRLRFRYKWLPVIDGFYSSRNVKDAQITNFFEPNEFNDVKIKNYGVSVEKPFNVAPYFDLFLSAGYSSGNREGLIEFLPDEEESFDQLEGNLNLSTFFGPDKITIETVYVHQDIHPDVKALSDRDRNILAAVLKYNLLRPLLGIPDDPYDYKYSIRGLEFSAGFLLDREDFDGVDVDKNSYFIGASLKGFRLSESLNPFDFTIQPTLFTSEVENDKDQDNKQYQTNMNILYRFIDEEKRPKQIGYLSAAFLHLNLPLQHTLSIDGPEDYENFRIGMQVSSKFFIKKLRGTSFLASIRYDFQRFYHLNKNLNQFAAAITMGF